MPNELIAQRAWKWHEFFTLCTLTDVFAGPLLPTSRQPT
jgi:hypothetical protein